MFSIALPSFFILSTNYSNDKDLPITVTPPNVTGAAWSHWGTYSGTDDDIAPPHVNREPIGGVQVGQNGRAYVGALLYERTKSYMECQIHELEQEAYSVDLRAFIG